MCSVHCSDGLAGGAGKFPKPGGGTLNGGGIIGGKAPIGGKTGGVPKAAGGAPYAGGGIFGIVGSYFKILENFEKINLLIQTIFNFNYNLIIRNDIIR